MNIRVVESDALQVTGAAALVIPANRQLTLDWGSHVAEAVRKQAGRSVEEEALRDHPEGVELGQAVLTGAGNLSNFTHLIHAAVLDKYDFNPLFLLRLKERTSGRTLESATRASLQCAADAGLASLVFTPMGAGIGGMRMSKCARIMIDEIRRFSSPPDVVIACWKKRAADHFRRRLAQPAV